MGTLFVFIVKSTLCLTVFYLFYRLLLSRDTFHRFNRIALLGILAFSVIIPFIHLASEAPVPLQHPLQNLEYLLLTAQMEVEAEAEPTPLSLWLTLVFAVYAGGCLFFAIRFLISLGHILRLIKSGKKEPLAGGIRLIVTDTPVSPFSWMKYIVISRIDLEENGKEILIHERAHIKSYHSFDMLLAGLCSILHWFNPASWLLKQELQNVHEYEADEQVILYGVDEKQYQLLLIKKAVGAQRFTSMANSFNHSKLKKRITMMLKQKSSSYGRLKYLYVLPLTAVAVVAFACPEVEKKVTVVSSDSIKVVGYDLGLEPVQNFGFEPRKLSEDSLRARSTFKLHAPKQTPLLFIDGKEVPYEEMAHLSPDRIESISVMKDENAVKIYGERAKDKGVLLITLKKE